MWISSTIVYIQLRSAQQVNNTFRVYIQIYIYVYYVLCIMYVCIMHVLGLLLLFLYLFMVKTAYVCAYAYCTIPQWLVDWLTGGQGGRGHGHGHGRC